MKVTLPRKRVRSIDTAATYTRVLVVSAVALVAVGCATNKPQFRPKAKPVAKVEAPQPVVTYVEPKLAHKTEVKLAEVPVLQFMPVKGVTQNQVANNFGEYRNGGRTHKGIDIFVPVGRELLAVTSGYIERTSSKLGGNSIYLRGDNGLTYYYAHLSRYHPKARSGERVDGGMVIGYVGKTGNAKSTPAHLHFEIRKNGVPFNPYQTLRDPELVLTPNGKGTPVQYASYKTGAEERAIPSKNSGGEARNSANTTKLKVTKKSASIVAKKSTKKSSTKKLAAKKKLTKKQQLAAKKAAAKKKQVAKKTKATKKNYTAKNKRRGHGSQG